MHCQTIYPSQKNNFYLKIFTFLHSHQQSMKEPHIHFLKGLREFIFFDAKATAN